MELKPVKQTEKPKYPLKTELNEESLKKQIPKRWAASPAARIALGTLAAMTLAGCGPEIMPGDVQAITPPTEASVSPTPSYVPEGTTVPAMINVAPLFTYGDGRGAFGCLMIAPPAFFSEDEALAVINDAALEYGLKFTREGAPVFGSVLQPVTDMYGSGNKTPDTYGEFTPDFIESEHGISIEFISTNDVENWNKSEPTISVGHYDTKDAAAQLSEALEIAIPKPFNNYSVGVLYDPCASADVEELLAQEERDEKAWDEAEAKARETAEEQLKAQAKDFFEWLKQQGVI